MRVEGRLQIGDRIFTEGVLIIKEPCQFGVQDCLYRLLTTVEIRIADKDWIPPELLKVRSMSLFCKDAAGGDDYCEIRLRGMQYSSIESDGHYAEGHYTLDEEPTFTVPVRILKIKHYDVRLVGNGFELLDFWETIDNDPVHRPD